MTAPLISVSKGKVKELKVPNLEAPWLRLLVPLIAAVLLNACAGYRPMASNGTGFGYQEQALGENSYVLRYVGGIGFSEDESWQTIEGFWRQRAGELCGHNNYSHTEYQKSKPCRTYHSIQSNDKLVRETRCLLELRAKLNC